MDDVTAAIVYARVSTDEQASEGFSLDAQAGACASEASRRGWTVARVVREAASARTLARPELARALADLDAGRAGALLVARLDRLSRSVGDFAAVLDRADRHGWAVLCLDPMVDMTTPFGRAMAGMASVFAQLEREIIAQRTREGIAAARAAGTYGRASLATPAAALVVDASIQAGGSWAQAARALDRERVPCPWPGGWTPRRARQVAHVAGIPGPGRARGPVPPRATA